MTISNQRRIRLVSLMIQNLLYLTFRPLLGPRGTGTLASMHALAAAGGSTYHHHQQQHSSGPPPMAHSQNNELTNGSRDNHDDDGK